MQLISMTTFVLEIEKTPYCAKSVGDYGESEAFRDYKSMFYKIENYANFLKQPLKLEMFVPCDDEGNVLEKPDTAHSKYDLLISEWEVDVDYSLFNNDCDKYQQAKEKILFEGFSVKNEDKYHVVSFKGFPTWLTWTNKAVEDLLNNEYIELTLTDSAKKQIGI